jgi:hypothetical protein
MKINTVARKAPEPQRNGYGHALVVDPTNPSGKRIPMVRATGLAGTYEDMFVLHQWDTRIVVTALAHPDNTDLLAAVRDSHPDDKSGLNDLIKEARTRGGGQDKAMIGTYVHALAEALDRGEDPWEVVAPPILSTGPANPDDYRRDLDAYVAATADMDALYVEQFLVNDWLPAAGTTDRIVKFQGKRYIADLKTGGIELGAGKIAAQLAIYARSRPYDVATDERLEPHGAEVDKGIIIHLPAGQGECHLWWVDLTYGWEIVKTCRDVREKRRKKFTHLTRPVAAPPPAPVSLADQIRVASTRDELTALWRIHASAWTDDLTELAARRTAALQEAQQQPTPTP